MRIFWGIVNPEGMVRFRSFSGTRQRRQSLQARYAIVCHGIMEGSAAFFPCFRGN
jgi:hypothetical protein